MNESKRSKVGRRKLNGKRVFAGFRQSLKIRQSNTRSHICIALRKVVRDVVEEDGLNGTLMFDPNSDRMLTTTEIGALISTVDDSPIAKADWSSF